MKKTTLLTLAAALAALLVFTVPAQAGGFRFSFGVGFSFGGGHYHPAYPWYGPVFYSYPRVAYGHAPYFRPVTVVRVYNARRVYRALPARKGARVHVYGDYVPRRYERRVIVTYHP